MAPPVTLGVDARVTDTRRDPLTGLGSRDLIKQASLDAGQSGRRSVVLIDLDQFRAINDTYGHENGDLVLRVVGERLAAVAGEDHLAARLSADEFVVVTPLSRRPDIEALAVALYAAVREPLEIAGTDLHLDAGVGIAIANGELSLWDLISRAGASLHDLKHAGRLPKIVLYDDDAHGGILDTLALSLDLRAALTHDELLLHYQPIVDMASREAIGFEALVRWSHPERGMIPPLSFIPLAERSGLMPELGAWILEQACLEARAWQDRFDTPPVVTVNISIRQLEDPDFVARFCRILAHAGCQPQQIKIEVTESVLASELERFAPPLEALRRMGVGVLLDDFGTGYSSLGYVRELPLDGVKLDRIFTRDLTISAGAWTLARSIIALLNQLDLEIIAEGLETAAHLAQLRSLGCHTGQGYYFAKPLPQDQLRFGRLSS